MLFSGWQTFWQTLERENCQWYSMEGDATHWWSINCWAEAFARWHLFQWYLLQWHLLQWLVFQWYLFQWYHSLPLPLYTWGNKLLNLFHSSGSKGQLAMCSGLQQWAMSKVHRAMGNDQLPMGKKSLFCTGSIFIVQSGHGGRCVQSKESWRYLRECCEGFHFSEVCHGPWAYTYIFVHGKIETQNQTF